MCTVYTCKLRVHVNYNNLLFEYSIPLYIAIVNSPVLYSQMLRIVYSYTLQYYVYMCTIHCTVS